jgi:hypothetical protein
MVFLIVLIRPVFDTIRFDLCFLMCNNGIVFEVAGYLSKYSGCCSGRYTRFLNYAVIFIASLMKWCMYISHTKVALPLTNKLSEDLAVLNRS